MKEKALPSSVAHRIIIVDDHPVFRLGLATLFQDEPDLVVAAAAKSAPEALARLREVPCDVAVIDICLPGANGIELLKQIRAEHPGLRTLLVSMHDESVYALRALRAGASGYVMKMAGPDTILAAVRKVLRGEIYVSPSYAEELIFQIARGAGGEGSPIEALTDRELEILQLIGQSLTSRQIAASLHLSVKTVESHRLHIKEKLGFQNSAAMVRFALEWQDGVTAVGMATP